MDALMTACNAGQSVLKSAQNIFIQPTTLHGTASQHGLEKLHQQGQLNRQQHG